MVDIIKALQSTPIPIILIIAGIIFILLGITGKIPKLEIIIPSDPKKITIPQVLALFFGCVFLVLGLVVQVIPPSLLANPVIQVTPPLTPSIAQAVGTSTSITPPLSTPTAFPTTSSVGIPFQVISQPNYANVGGTLVSDSLSGQYIELRLSFVNHGKGACTAVKFHTLDLSNSSGPPLKPTSSIDQSWTLPSGVPQPESVQFQIRAGSGSQYTLTFYLDVGGCVTPHNNSPNRYANYKVEFSLTK